MGCRALKVDPDKFARSCGLNDADALFDLLQADAVVTEDGRYARGEVPPATWRAFAELMQRVRQAA